MQLLRKQQSVAVPASCRAPRPFQRSSDSEGLSHYRPSPSSSPRETRAKHFLWQRVQQPALTHPRAFNRNSYHSKASFHWSILTYRKTHFCFLESKMNITIPILHTGKEKTTFHHPEHPEQGRTPGGGPRTALQSLKTSCTNGPVNNSVWTTHTPPQFCSKPPLGSVCLFCF